MTTRARVIGLMLAMGAFPALAFAQLSTGTILGTASDNTGGVLPGATVTLTGVRLLGGAQIETTDRNGGYRFDRLSPGDYEIKFELQGFKTYERHGIHVSAGFLAPVNVNLQVGSVSETVTVSGESPVVDTKSNVQQVVMDQRLLEGLPTGRDPWSVGRLIPGVTVSTFDVGGTQGMQQSAMSIHGSTDNNKIFAIDGIPINWPGAGGGGTGIYYDQGMFEEVNYQTSALPAEIAVGGVTMNMVTKEGSNAFRGSTKYLFANDKLQANNWSAANQAQYKFNGGNPVVSQYDLNADVGGPIDRDKLWFFGSFRRWHVDKLQLGGFYADGSPAIDDNMVTNGSAKLSWQASHASRLGFLYNRNQKNRYHRRNATPIYQDLKATVDQEQPGYTSQGKYTGVLGNRGVFESSVSYMHLVFPLVYQASVQPTDLSRIDATLSTLTGAPQRSDVNPGSRIEVDNSLSWTVSSWAGTHNFKLGEQFSRQWFHHDITANYDMQAGFRNGAASYVDTFNTPIVTDQYLRTFGVYVQDAWAVHRLTVNVGGRFDWDYGTIPTQHKSAGTFAAAADYPAISGIPDFKLFVPRLGVAYDVTGDGKTAIKGSVSRYGHGYSAGDLDINNPAAFATDRRSWTDTNGDGFPQLTEIGPANGFVTTVIVYAPGTKLPYSDEISVGIEREVLPAVRVSATYFHRTNRNQLGAVNLAVPVSAWIPFNVTNPVTGQALTVYSMNPAFLGQKNIQIINNPAFDADYNGIDLTLTKRMSNRWQLLSGFSGGRNRGGFIRGVGVGGGIGSTEDANNPNLDINRQGIVGDDATYQLKVGGTYVLPLDINISSTYQHQTGYPLRRQFIVDRTVLGFTPTPASFNVDVVPRGTNRNPSMSLLDLRVSKTFKRGRVSVAPSLEIFNVRNDATFLQQVDTIGPLLGFPAEILSARIARVGVQMSF